MARIRQTPVRRRYAIARIPGYVPSPYSHRYHARKAAEYRAKRAKEALALNERRQRSAAALAIIEREGEAYFKRKEAWFGRRRRGEREFDKSWMTDYLLFKPRRKYLAEFHRDRTPTKHAEEARDRMKALDLPMREKGFVEGYHFIVRLERAFTEARVGEDQKSELALQYVDGGFEEWIRRYSTGVGYHIPWSQFTLALFTYVMAFEADGDYFV